jgi:hypothetical protein
MNWPRGALVCNRPNFDPLSVDGITIAQFAKDSQTRLGQGMTGARLQDPARYGNLNKCVAFHYHIQVTAAMYFEWDPAKEAENLAKHNVDFSTVVRHGAIRRAWLSATPA